MEFLKRLLREPILHFLAAGALLYAVAAYVRGPDLMPGDENTIVVDREKLLLFLQFRSNAFDAQAFATALDSLSEQELNQYIDQYVNEEVLFREASTLGLAESDYIIRQRMIQKMQFLLGDLANVSESVADEELKKYFEENKQAYWVKPSATFTHVFFDASRRGDNVDEVAMQARRQLNQQHAGFNDVLEIGDRFVFLRNYVERTLDFVEGHFGNAFAQQLEQLQASETEWQGPFQSVYGYHVVLLTELKPGYFPELSDVRDIVQRDYLSESQQQTLAEMTQSIRERYNVKIENLRSTAP